MTKIAEQKSYEEYPLLTHKDFERFEVFDNHIFERQAYIKGYDKAIQDFEEFLHKNNRGQLIRRFEDYIFKEKEEE